MISLTPLMSHRLNLNVAIGRASNLFKDIGSPVPLITIGSSSILCNAESILEISFLCLSLVLSSNARSVSSKPFLPYLEHFSLFLHHLYGVFTFRQIAFSNPKLVSKILHLIFLHGSQSLGLYSSFKNSFDLINSKPPSCFALKAPKFLMVLVWNFLEYARDSFVFTKLFISSLESFS